MRHPIFRRFFVFLDPLRALAEPSFYRCCRGDPRLRCFEAPAAQNLDAHSSELLKGSPARTEAEFANARQSQRIRMGTFFAGQIGAPRFRGSCAWLGITVTSLHLSGEKPWSSSIRASSFSKLGPSLHRPRLRIRSTMEIDMIIIRLCSLACVALAASFLLVAYYEADTNTRSAISRSADGDRVAQDDDNGNAQAPAPAAPPDTGSGDDSNGPADSRSPGQDQE